MSKFSKAVFSIDMLGSLIGFPFCFLIYLAMVNPNFPSVDAETVARAWPVLGGIASLSLLFLILERNTPGGDARNMRGWAIGALLMAGLVALLLAAEVSERG